MNYEQQVAHYREVRARITGAALRPPLRPAPVIVAPVEELETEKQPRVISDFRRRIVHECAEEFGVTVEDILGSSRKTQVVVARRKAAWRLYQRGRMSLCQIGKVLNKDHTSILHAVRKSRQEQKERAQT